MKSYEELYENYYTRCSILEKQLEELEEKYRKLGFKALALEERAKQANESVRPLKQKIGELESYIDEIKDTRFPDLNQTPDVAKVMKKFLTDGIIKTLQGQNDGVVSTFGFLLFQYKCRYHKLNQDLNKAIKKYKELQRSK